MKSKHMSETFRVEGNEFYNEFKFYEALLSYNKSLCYSIPKSTEISIVYANRSAVYLEMKMIEECLVNIVLARENGYKNFLRLNKREDKCLQLMGTQLQKDTEESSTFFKLSYPANEKIPFIVDCLRVSEEEKFGRCVVTNQKLKPGDVIAVEEPCFKSIDENAHYSRCANCLKSKFLNLLPCLDSCSFTMFCDEKCRDEGMRRFHKVECKAVDKFYSVIKIEKQVRTNPFVMLRGLSESLTMTVERLQLLARELKKMPEELTELDVSAQREELMNTSAFESFQENGKIEKFQGTEQQESSDLCNSLVHVIKALPEMSSELDVSTQEEVLLNGLAVVNFLKGHPDTEHQRVYEKNARNMLQSFETFDNFITSDDDRNFLVKFAARLMQIRNINAWSYQYQDQFEGSGILPFCSLMNHSCDPNVQAVTVDNKFACVVIKPIGKDEQIFINYKCRIFLTKPREERQAELMESYGFLCSCPSCTNFPSPESLPQIDPTFVLPNASIPSTFQEAVDEFRQNSEYLEQNFELHPSLETFSMLMRNIELLTIMGDIRKWPF